MREAAACRDQFIGERAATSLERLAASTIPNETDVIVVGAGSAGCVMAARLAERGQRVLLLETGPAWPNDPDLPVPGLAEGLVGGELVWPAPRTPQTAAGNRVVPLATGRVLGGASSVNATGWFHAQPGDFDRQQAAGALGWNAPEMQELNRRVSHDLNGVQRTGVSLAYSNVRDGRRVGVVDAYLAADIEVPGLTVSTDTHVTALLVDGERVVGVEARVADRVRPFTARHGSC